MNITSLLASDSTVPANANCKDHSTYLDVQCFINSQPLSRYQWRIMLLCFLIVFLDGLDTAAMGFIIPALSQEWGIDRASLGPVMSAALVGMIFGALGSGPLADRFGRKQVLVLATVMFGTFSVAAALSTSLNQLMAWRLLAGLGLGAAMPNATTLLSEYSPQRLRSLLVTSMFCGFNLGMASGGFFSVWLIPAYGWHSLLLAGGLLPLTLAIFLWLALPESASYLVVRNKPTELIRKMLLPIGDAARTAKGFCVAQSAADKGRGMLRLVMSGHYRVGTLLLWFSNFMGLMIIYLLTSWLPTLMRDSGASVEHSAVIGALFQLGGVFSAMGVGWAMDRYNPHTVIGAFYLMAGGFVWLVGQSVQQLPMLATLVLLAGMCVNGAQSAMPSLAARFYPTQGRATGISWMLGIGRFGGVTGAWAGATLLGAGWEFEQVLTALVVPATLATIAILIKGLVSHSDVTQ
jgi:AAHS family 4-hydroxybenzoate transporter-like MFS transporter